MSERFAEGFVVSTVKLTDLLGTPTLGFAAVHKAIGKKPIWDDLVMTLGDGDDEDGIAQATAGLDALAAGKVPGTNYVERIVQLVLHAYGEPLEPAPMEANFMPADQDNGLWNPAFAALGMSTIAKQWGRSNLAFPRKRAKVDFGWPVITVVEPAALALWKTELATKWRAKLEKLPNSTFDPEADDDDEDPYMSHDEVERGIVVLEKWVAAASKRSTSKRKAVAPSGNALIVVIDGDQ